MHILYMLLLLQVDNFPCDLSFLYEYLISRGYFLAGLYFRDYFTIAKKIEDPRNWLPILLVFIHVIVTCKKMCTESLNIQRLHTETIIIVAIIKFNFFYFHFVSIISWK